MITARIRAQLGADSWVRAVSESFPEATLRLLSGVSTADGAVELGSVTATDPDAVLSAMNAHPKVWDVEPLGRSGAVVQVRFETSDTGLYEFTAEHGFPPPYPIVVRDGWEEFEFTGTRADLDTVRSAFEGADCGFELRSLRGTDASSDLLTDRQREVLETARRAGYFDVPRACTLADVAATLGIDKSTASEILRRGQDRIVSWYLTGAAGEPGG